MKWKTTVACSRNNKKCFHYKYKGYKSERCISFHLQDFWHETHEKKKYWISYNSTVCSNFWKCFTKQIGRGSDIIIQDMIMLSFRKLGSFYKLLKKGNKKVIHSYMYLIRPWLQQFLNNCVDLYLYLSFHD